MAVSPPTSPSKSGPNSEPCGAATTQYQGQVASHKHISTSSTLSSGVVVHNWRPENPDSVPPKAILILQHGFAEYVERYVESYNELIPRLTDAGFDVWAMDMWGHGRSPGDRGIVNIKKAVADHVELRREVAKFQRERGMEGPVILFGHSLGGLVTAGSVVLGQEQKETGGLRVDGVVLTGPALTAPAPLLGRFVAGPIAAIAPTLRLSYARVKVEEACKGNPDEWAKVTADPLMFHGQISFRLAATALQVAARVWAGLGEKWSVPTLVVHGSADTYTEPSQSLKFVAEIGSEDKRFRSVEGGFHESLNDVPGRDEILGEILEWLETRVKQVAS